MCWWHQRQKLLRRHHFANRNMLGCNKMTNKSWHSGGLNWVRGLRIRKTIDFISFLCLETTLLNQLFKMRFLASQLFGKCTHSCFDITDCCLAAPKALCFWHWLRRMWSSQSSLMEKCHNRCMKSIIWRNVIATNGFNGGCAYIGGRFAMVSCKHGCFRMLSIGKIWFPQTDLMEDGSQLQTTN